VRVEAITYQGRAYPPQPIVFGIDVVDESANFGDDY